MAAKLTEISTLQAFQKVKEETKFTDGELVLITPELYQEALNLMKEHFVHDEPMAIAFGVQWCEEAEQFWNDVFEDGISLGVVNDKSGELIAVRGMKVTIGKEADDNTDRKVADLNVPNDADRNNDTGAADKDVRNEFDEKLKQMMDFIKQCGEKADALKSFKGDLVVNFLGLCVAEPYRKKGIASALFGAALKFIENLGISNVFVQGDGSSNFSQRIYENFGFQTLYETSFSDYGNDRGIVLQDTGAHKTYKIYGKCMQCNQ